MRSLSCMVFALATGCGAYATYDSHGVTKKEFEGNVSVVFTNATPDRICGLHMTSDGNGKYGDNWVSRDGLATGKSIDMKLKPGKYKANWNTCKQGNKPWYAGTLTHETSFEVKEATQLFAFVADTVAPTSRAAPRDLHKMVKFPGQQVGGTVIAKAPPPPVPTTEPVAKTDPKSKKTAATTPAKSGMGDFVDYKAAYKNTKGKTLKPKASVKRTHDVVNAKVGYSERKK